MTWQSANLWPLNIKHYEKKTWESPDCGPSTNHVCHELISIVIIFIIIICAQIGGKWKQNENIEKTQYLINYK